MASVLVSIPSFSGDVRLLCAESVANLDWGDDEVCYRNVAGHFCDQARNRQARLAIDGGYDFLMMVDSDMVVPPDALVNLRSLDVNVALGWGVRGTSDEGRTSVIPLGAAGYHGGFTRDELHALRARGVHSLEVKGGGLCCALIRVDVLGRVARPWFAYRQQPELGEDYWFCEQCRKAGISIHADTRVGCGHIHDRILEA